MAQERQTAERAGLHLVADDVGVLLADRRRRTLPEGGDVPALRRDATADLGDSRLGLGVRGAARERKEADEGEDGDERKTALHGSTWGERFVGSPLAWRHSSIHQNTHFVHPNAPISTKSSLLEAVAHPLPIQ